MWLLSPNSRFNVCISQDSLFISAQQRVKSLSFSSRAPAPLWAKFAAESRVARAPLTERALAARSKSAHCEKIIHFKFITLAKANFRVKNSLLPSWMSTHYNIWHAGDGLRDSRHTRKQPFEPHTSSVACECMHIYVPLDGKKKEAGIVVHSRHLKSGNTLPLQFDKTDFQPSYPGAQDDFS